MIKENIDQADRWLTLGVTPIPLAYQTKRPLVPWTCWRDRVPPKQLVHAWFRMDYRNIGIVLRNNLVALDFDTPGSYWLWRKETRSRFADSKTVRSSRGWHVYVKVEQPFTEIAWMVRGGEIRGNGIMVVPPSVHRNGAQYQELNGWDISTVGSIDELGIEYVKDEGRELALCSSGPIFIGDGIVSRILSAIWIDEYLSRFTKIVYEQHFAVCRCPFHNDHNPSMQIDVTNGWAYCHNPTCVAHRKCTVITVAMLMMGFDARDAVRFLASEIG